MQVSRKSRTSLPKQQASHSDTMTEQNQSQVQADASQRGSGACLVQEGKPIAFASKSLTDTETRYANTERELLAIVFACQRFNTYVLGRQFTVESDHKPLEMIHQKSLASTSPRLQRMLLQLQRYDLTIIYRLGKDMLLTNALSRCPSRGSEAIILKNVIVTIIVTLPFHRIKIYKTTKYIDLKFTLFLLFLHHFPLSN